MRVMRMGRAGTRGGEGAGPLESAALRWGKTMVASARIGNRGDVHGVRGRTVDAGGETGAPTGVAADGQGTVRRARWRASDAVCEGTPGARARGSALLRRLSSLGRPVARRGVVMGLHPLRLLAAAVLLIAALGAPLTVQAQTTTTLVSNLGQSGDEAGFTVSTTQTLAQQFTTGPAPAGYTLKEVEAVVVTSSSGTIEFALYTSTSGNEPGTKVVDLNGSVVSSGRRSFTPSSATTLAASTKYFVVFKMVSGAASSLRPITADDEDSGAKPGWSIANNGLWNSGSRWRTINSGQTIKIAIKGVILNSAPTGTLGISGFPRVGDVLTASVDDIADADGLTGARYEYQWVRVDGTRESDIALANGPTYRLAGADLGKTVKVRVSFTDDAGSAESVTSAAFPDGGVLAAAVCKAPTYTGGRQEILKGEMGIGETTGIHGFSGAGLIVGRLTNRQFMHGGEPRTIDQIFSVQFPGVNRLQVTLNALLAQTEHGARNDSRLTVHVCDQGFVDLGALLQYPQMERPIHGRSTPGSNWSTHTPRERCD